MSLEEDDKPPRNQIWDDGIVVVAALLTLCAIGVCFFPFTIAPAKKPQPVANTSVPGEVTIGLPTRKTPDSH
jgi:hypothetical protein